MIARDTYCLDSLKTGRYASGAQLVGQRLYRALTSPRGCLRGSPAHEQWGDDLNEVIGMSGAAKDFERAIRAKVSRACSKDEQISSFTCDVLTTTETNGASTATVTIDAQTAFGPFNLVLAISEVTVQILGIT